MGDVMDSLLTRYNSESSEFFNTGWSLMSINGAAPVLVPREFEDLTLCRELIFETSKYLRAMPLFQP